VGLLGLALAASATGCKKDDAKKDEPAAKKDEPAAKKDDAAKAPAPAADTLALEPFQGGTPELAIEANVPKGWTVGDWSGGGKMYSDPMGGMFPSTVIVSTDCAGNCATIAENIKAYPDKQIEMHKGAGYTEVKELERKELPGGGLQLYLQVARPGEEPMFHFVHFVYEAGWPVAASCSSMTLGKALPHKDMLKDACASLKAHKP
jgi:hypothetical protein